MNLHVIILGAGQGKRMYSELPKVLHPLAGTPMLLHVIAAAQRLKPTAIHLVYGHGGEQLKQALAHVEVNWVHQAEQLGTGHAVLQALPHIPADAQVLILYGDVPLLQSSTLNALVTSAQPNNLALLVAHLENPYGLGRILRDQHAEIISIVEEKDANEQEKKIKEIYSGICCVKADALASWLPQISDNNAQKEYYLTEIITLAKKMNYPISSLTVTDTHEIQGVNTRQQLHDLERLWQYRQAQRLLEQGVAIADAHRFDLRGELTCGRDVFIDVNCVFLGKVTLEDGVKIGPNCYLKDVHVSKGCHILPCSVIEESTLGEECHIGPFARLRTGHN